MENLLRVCCGKNCGKLVGCWWAGQQFDCPTVPEDCSNYENCPLFKIREKIERTSTLCDECFFNAIKKLNERRKNEKAKKKTER